MRIIEVSINEINGGSIEIMCAKKNSKFKINKKKINKILVDEMKKLKELLGEDYWNNGNYEKAVEIFEKMYISPECEEFLTLPAYEEIISISN